jgi:hypothetical protein
MAPSFPIDKMKNYHYYYIFLLAIGSLLLSTCAQQDATLFRLISPGQSGIFFSNTIDENDSVNILNIEYLYNGGGVGIGDFNNDGLSDIFFTGNQVSNKLYLNTGDFKFKDVTDLSGVSGNNTWRSGVAVVDINSDGLLDIYVCATLRDDSVGRANSLYINLGLDQNGIPTFADRASEYGIAHNGHTQNAAFFDYNKDGFLDLFLLINKHAGKSQTKFFHKVVDGTSPSNDKLFRNNGNGTFTDVTIPAGILAEGFGLGLAIADINNDSWPDIYISNDYLTNDVLYINNHDGTFSDKIDDYIKHQSQFSMGNDVADINNDGLLDIITLDMLPENNLRRKCVIAGGSYTSYINNLAHGYSPQHVRNMLYLNNGDESFSEIGQLAGVHQTEWSWSPLFMDIDNDGLRDLVITNGFPKDVTDKDFGMFRSSQAGAVSDVRTLIDSIPVVKVPNQVFRNTGNLKFENVTDAWGMNQASFSNGAAFADLDNDGDLDYVVNNINQTAFLYENTLVTRQPKSGCNFLRIKALTGKASNPGTKITIYYNGKMQYHDHSVYRGYLSSVEDVIHFGIGEEKFVDSLVARWPDGQVQTILNIPANQLLQVRHEEAEFPAKVHKAVTVSLFSNVEQKTNIMFKHEEQDVIDFNVQRTLPHKYSQYGPGLSVGDLNGDGLEDFFVTGPAGKPGTFFFQLRNGKFKKQDQAVHGKKLYEDLCGIFFDFDNDEDLDLFTVSGSSEFSEDDINYEDHLFTNDGHGKFNEVFDVLPSNTQSGSCARVADFDNDGDLDLFVGGRVRPGKYPLPPKSILLENHNGKFRDVTSKWCSEMLAIGMVTDALWTDFNNDGYIDLVVVGELLPVSFFKNNGNKFVNVTPLSGIGDRLGWWNSINAGDFDNDGDTDYVAGNLGLNNYYQASQQFPMKVYAKDFDGNGSIDPITACFFKMDDDSKQLCPVHFWEELNSLSPRFRRQFASFADYGNSTMERVLSKDDLQGTLVLEGNYPQTSIIENLGNDKFRIKSLPISAQFSPVFGILVEDFNGDSDLDVIMIGNDYGNEVFSGRADAFTGLFFAGNGRGDFTSINSIHSGFKISGDGKALVKLFNGKDHQLLVAAQNQDSLKVFDRPFHGVLFSPGSRDRSAEIHFADGRKQKVEFYYGSGYLSQSSRKLIVTQNMREITVTDFSGQRRKLTYETILTTTKKSSN